MGYKKIKDLCVKTGEYTKDGETKPRYENIGGFFKNEEGKTFLTIKKTFNPAGVETEFGRDSIVVSVFDLREDGEKPQQRQTAKPAAKAAPAAAASDDDIPF